MRPNLINQPNWNYTHEAKHVITDSNGVVHWKGLENSNFTNTTISFQFFSNKKYIIEWNYRIISGEFITKSVHINGKNFPLNNADKNEGRCSAIIEGIDGNGILIYFSGRAGDEAEFWNFKLEEIKEGESEMPTDFCLSLEDIAKLNEQLAKENNV